MRFETFQKHCQEVGLQARECSLYHWQVLGGKFLVNYFMSERKGNTVYVQGQTHGVSARPSDAIKYANQLPNGVETVERKHSYQTAKRMLLRKGSLCKLCNKPVSEEEASVDHKIPLALGGLNNRNNYQLTHKDCNAKKGHNV